MKTKTNLILVLFCIFSVAHIFVFAQKSSEQKDLRLRDPEPTLIESLQNGESFSIEITSIGCFNGSRQTVFISKEEDTVTASLNDVSKLLTDTDIETLKSFELQLQSLKMGGCTTIDTYVLRFGNQTFQTSDGTCSWHGYRKLLAIFS